jgi:hypothetical protein
MPNVTLAMDDGLLEDSRRYAAENNISLNAMIRSLLERTVRPRKEVWVDECFQLMDAVPGRSNGRKWKREDAYNGRA